VEWLALHQAQTIEATAEMVKPEQAVNQVQAVLELSFLDMQTL
jgi:hypothetical protein